jgi:hypothetical protein
MVVDLPVDSVPTTFELESASVAFFNGAHATNSSHLDRLFNKAAHYICPGFTHTELAFRFLDVSKEHECWISCCIYRGESLHFEAKTGKFFNNTLNSLWTLVKLTLKKEKLEQLLLDCKNDVLLGLTFTKSLYWNFLPPFRFCQIDPGLGDTTWCTHHVASRLKNLEILEIPSPASLSPQQLYLQLLNSGFYIYSKLMF